MKTDGAARKWALSFLLLIASMVALVALVMLPGSPALAGPNVWTGAGPRVFVGLAARDATGGVFAVASSSFNVVYNAHPSTAVYKSADGGETWSVVGDYATAAGAHYGLPVSLAASSDGSVLMLIVHSDRATPDREPTSLLKSTDGGATWKLLLPYFEIVARSFAVSRITIDPQDSSRLYMNGAGGFFRSTDGGATWQAMPGATNGSNDSRLTNLVGRIAVDPANPAHLVAASSAGIALSDDHGDTWRRMPSSQDNPVVSPDLAESSFPVFVARQGGPSYLIMSAQGTRNSMGLYLSKDGGTSWERVLSFPANSRRLGLDASQGKLYLSLRTRYPDVASPGNATPTPSPTPQVNPSSQPPQQDYDLLYTSSDGENWTLVRVAPFWLGSDTASVYYPDGLLVSQKDPKRIFRVDGTFSADGGQSWASPNESLPLSEVPVSAFVNTSVGWLAGSGQSLYRRRSKHQGWELIYQGSDFFYANISGMTAWEDTTGQVAMLFQLFPARVTGGPGGHFERPPRLMRSTNEGVSWQPVLAPDGYSARFASRDPEGSVYLAISPYYNYGSGSYASREKLGGLYKSTDEGATWTTLNPGMVVNNIAIDPADQRHLWAAGDDGMAESRDAGATWTAVKTNPQVGGHVFVGSNATLFAYGAGGYRQQQSGNLAPGPIRGPLYKSTDAGRTWAKVTIPGAPADYSVRMLTVGGSFAGTGSSQVVVSWSPQNAPGQVQISESLDGGRTWSTLSGLGLGGYTDGDLDIEEGTGNVLAVAGRLLSYTVQSAPPDPAFTALWQRQDDPVQKGLAQRSWTWGPQPFATVREPLKGLPGDSRVVQYFDKSRMEVNDPSADRKSPWFVTNGLLVVEMVAGRVQVGLNTWEQRAPASLPVAGDASQGGQPTYASFRGVASYENRNNTSPNRVGATISQGIDAAGQVTTTVPLTPQVKLAAYDGAGGHNIAAPFWTYLNQTGKVLENGKYVDRPLFPDWVFVMGRPITEPYWVRVYVQGKGSIWVLVQLFERRVLTYTPSNPPVWQVEMGNVGLHYYLWRYGGN